METIVKGAKPVSRKAIATIAKKSSSATRALYGLALEEKIRTDEPAPKEGRNISAYVTPGLLRKK
jgi:hypothetical protein